MKQHKIKESLFLKFISISIMFLFFIVCSSSYRLNNLPVDIYVGGESFISSTSVPVAVYWKNGEMVQLSRKYWKSDKDKPIHSTEMSRVNSIAVAGDDIYSGGYYVKYDFSANPNDVGTADFEVKVACYWKNGKLVTLSNSKYGSEVKTIFVSGNYVYAGGYIFSKDAGKGGYWKNGKWVDLSSSVESIFVSGDDVYACGNSRGRPGYWKNNERIALSPISEKERTYTYSIFVSGNDVYVCGEGRNDLGVATACYWKNGELIPLLSFESKYNSKGASIFVSGNDVYVGGYSHNRRFPSVAGYWKNDKWIALTPIDNEASSEVTSIFIFGNDVYAAGDCISNNGRHIPGYWKNGEWVGFNAHGGPDTVSSIVVVPCQYLNRSELNSSLIGTICL